MANGTFNVVHVTEQLLKAYGVPWNLAPAEIATAYAALDTAQRAHVDTVDAVSDAEVAIPSAQAAWDADAKAAVKAGKPLPSRDPVDRARFILELAQEDERKARTKAQNAVGTLAYLLHKPDVRTAWREAIGTRLDEIDANLEAHAATVSPLVTEAVVGTSLTFYLGEWLSHPGLPGIQSADPIGALRTVAGLRRWTAPKPAGEPGGNITA